MQPPFRSSQSAMATNRVVKVRSTGYLRISPARDGTSLLTITSTLNSFRQQGTQLPKVTEKDPHLPERTVLEMRAILRMLLRLKDDFDKSAAIDSYFFKKLIDTEVRHPPKLNGENGRKPIVASQEKMFLLSDRSLLLARTSSFARRSSQLMKLEPSKKRD